MNQVLEMAFMAHTALIRGHGYSTRSTRSTSKSHITSDVPGAGAGILCHYVTPSSQRR